MSVPISEKMPPKAGLRESSRVSLPAKFSAVMRRVVEDQRLLFLVIGGINTVFATLLFAMLLHLSGPGVPSVVLLTVAWAASLLTGFLAHRWLVFRVSGHFWSDFARYTGVNYMALLVNAAAMALLADVMGLPPIPVQIGVICLTIVFSYVGHRFFSFRRKQ